MLEPAFRQNPLVDNDYVFGQALGRYCKHINLDYPAPMLKCYDRVYGTRLIMGILQKSFNSSWETSTRSKQ